MRGTAVKNNRCANKTGSKQNQGAGFRNSRSCGAGGYVLGCNREIQGSGNLVDVVVEQPDTVVSGRNDRSGTWDGGIAMDSASGGNRVSDVQTVGYSGFGRCKEQGGDGYASR